MMSNEARTIALAAAALRERRTPFFVATVVRVSGSSYRRPGARLLATAEHRIAGSVSGGCLERDLIRTGFWRTRSGPVVVRYDSSDLDDDDADDGSAQHDRAQLGCGGIVDVFLERGGVTPHDVDPARDRGLDLDPIAFASAHASFEEPAAIATVFRSTIPDVPLGARWCLSNDRLHGSLAVGQAHSSEIAARLLSSCRDVLSTGGAAPYRHELPNGEIEALVEAILPPPHLFVFGAGLDVIPVVENVRRLGWNVTVWDPSGRFEARDRFFGLADVVASDLEPLRDRIDHVRAFAIVMSHNRQHDQRALAMLLKSRASYIGVLGPRHRTESLLGASASRMLADPRVRAPVGLDLGAETPEEIALSITAEMLSCSRKATANELNGTAAIHSSASSF